MTEFKFLLPSCQVKKIIQICADLPTPESRQPAPRRFIFGLHGPKVFHPVLGLAKLTASVPLAPVAARYVVG